MGRERTFTRQGAAAGIHLSTGGLAATLLILAIAGCKPPSTPGNGPKPTATPRPTPIPVIDEKRMSVSRLFNGMEVVSQIDPVRSEETASYNRVQPGTYRLELTVRADVPVPSRTLDQITRNDPSLPQALQGLDGLLATARVSPFFDILYALKLDYLKARLSRIDTLLSMHNFYDLETALEFQNPDTGARALFLQGDMDVNTDGSDGDRNFPVSPNTQFYQPQTSYRWKRLTDRPNPFQAPLTRKLATLKDELAARGLTVDRKEELRAAISDTDSSLYEVRHYSFLIAGADPFIVLPLSMLHGTGEYAPQIGDYAIVVYRGVCYRAVVGDAGPSYKFGEASLRICKQLDSTSTANSRPVDQLKVTYLVFPGSKDASPAPPDLDRWHDRCATLLNRLGLRPSSLHSWANLIRPWPTPTPTPSPTPTPAETPTPAATPTPGTSASPTPQPSPSATPDASPSSHSSSGAAETD
jgi:hypothetical protein